MLQQDGTIHKDAQVNDSEIGSWVEVGSRVSLVECQIGDYSYVSHDSNLMYTAVGKFTSIASHVRINPSNHPMWRASQHHFSYRGTKYGLGDDDVPFFDWRKENNVVVGHDVWIGHGAIILPGKSIGSGAVIGAGAIVTKDVPDYAIVGGNPAKLIRYRFDEKIREALLELAWWDWDDEYIRANYSDFQNLPIEEFLEKHKNTDGRKEQL